MMLLLPTIVADPIRAETAGICVSADTWFSEANNGQNGANSHWLTTKGSTEDRVRTLLDFDISSLQAGASVTTATVSLWVIDPDSSAVTVRRMTNSWTESGATWQNTTNAFSATVAASFTPNTENVFRTFDIASLVQSWLDGTYPNYGIMLVASSTKDKARFDSREAQTASQRPCMTVTYSHSPVVGNNRFEI